MISHLDNSTVPSGPTMVIGELSLRSPDSLIGACTPKTKESVMDIST